MREQLRRTENGRFGRNFKITHFNEKRFEQYHERMKGILYDNIEQKMREIKELAGIDEKIEEELWRKSKVLSRGKSMVRVKSAHFSVSPNLRENHVEDKISSVIQKVFQAQKQEPAIIEYQAQTKAQHQEKNEIKKNKKLKAKPPKKHLTETQKHQKHLIDPFLVNINNLKKKSSSNQISTNTRPFTAAPFQQLTPFYSDQLKIRPKDTDFEKLSNLPKSRLMSSQPNLKAIEKRVLSVSKINLERALSPVKLDINYKNYPLKRPGSSLLSFVVRKKKERRRKSKK